MSGRSLPESRLARVAAAGALCAVVPVATHAQGFSSGAGRGSLSDWSGYVAVQETRSLDRDDSRAGGVRLTTVKGRKELMVTIEKGVARATMFVDDVETTDVDDAGATESSVRHTSIPRATASANLSLDVQAGRATYSINVTVPQFSGRTTFESHLQTHCRAPCVPMPPRTEATEAPYLDGHFNLSLTDQAPSAEVAPTALIGNRIEVTDLEPGFGMRTVKITSWHLVSSAAVCKPLPGALAEDIKRKLDRVGELTRSMRTLRNQMTAAEVAGTGPALARMNVTTEAKLAMTRTEQGRQRVRQTRKEIAQQLIRLEFEYEELARYLNGLEGWVLDPNAGFMNPRAPRPSLFFPCKFASSGVGIKG